MLRGLIAAAVWGSIWPEHKERLRAASSIYDVSIKVYTNNIWNLPSNV